MVPFRGPFWVQNRVPFWSSKRVPVWGLNRVRLLFCLRTGQGRHTLVPALGPILVPALGPILVPIWGPVWAQFWFLFAAFWVSLSIPFGSVIALMVEVVWEDSAYMFYCLYRYHACECALAIRSLRFQVAKP